MKLPEKWVRHMVSLPETAMGWQAVVVTLYTGVQHDAKVFWSEELVCPVTIKVSDITDIQLRAL